MKHVILNLVAAVILLTACGGDPTNIRGNENCGYKSYPGFEAYTWVADDIDVKDIGWEKRGVFHSSGLYLYSSIIRHGGGYYIAPFGGEDDFTAVVTSYEDAPKVIAWLDKAVAKIEEVEQQMKDLDIEEVHTEIDLPMDFTLYGFILRGSPVLEDNPQVDLEVVTPVATLDITSEMSCITVKAKYPFLTKLDIYIMDEARDFYVSVLEEREYMKECLDAAIANEIKRRDFESTL